MDNLPVKSKLHSHEGLELTDYKFLRASIGQPTSKKHIEGVFNFTTGDTSNELIGVVPLFVTKSRVLYAKGTQSGSLCKSDNHRVPSKHVKDPICSDCSQCPASAWGENDAKAKICQRVGKVYGNPPICKETFNIWFVNKETMIPFCVSLNGTQIKPCQLFFTSVKNKGLDFYECSVDVKLTKLETKDGKFYQVLFTNIQKLEDSSTFKAIYDMLRQHAEDMTAQANEEVDGELKTVNKQDIKNETPKFNDEDPLPF